MYLHSVMKKLSSVRATVCPENMQSPHVRTPRTDMPAPLQMSQACRSRRPHTVRSSAGGYERGSHFRCEPGTDNDVINIVKHRKRNTVPASAKNLRRIMNLESKMIRFANLRLHNMHAKRFLAPLHFIFLGDTKGAKNTFDS